jgi:hypothetical protein
MKATLNLRKDDLLAKLNERKAEITANAQEEVDEIQAVIDARVSATDNTTLHAEYYEQIAAGLKDGSITLNPGTGKLKGAPARPGTKGYTGGAPSAPKKRVRRRHGYDWEWYDNENLESHIQQIREQEKAAHKPLDTAIDLLNLSTDEVVEIDTADYQALLSGQNRYGW